MGNTNYAKHTLNTKNEYEKIEIIMHIFEDYSKIKKIWIPGNNITYREYF
jgi:hypothetical protein